MVRILVLDDGAERFQCDDETTIDGNLLCNGIKDCADGSDEKSFCKYVPCHLLRCDYGACVLDPSICGTTNQETATDWCQIGNIPQNGHIALASNPTKHLSVNAKIPNYGSIQYGCDAGYHLIGERSTDLCVNGKWSIQNAAPTCEPRCNMTEISSITYMTNCYKSTDRGNEEVRCIAADLVEPGVTVHVACRSGYRTAQANGQRVTCDRNGRWSDYPKPCQQVCGEEGAAVDGFIFSGSITDNRRVPWHVGIYHIADDTRKDREPTYICGGTIINARMVISAIHCFWNAAFEEVSPASEYRVVAGKFYHRFNDAREKKQFQLLHVQRIEYPPGYNDYNGLYANDIAILILDKHIEFRPNVAPACVNLHYGFEERVITPGSWGRVAGWGLTKVGGDPSDELKSIEIPVVNRAECRSSLDGPTRPFLTDEKFCAGVLNQNAGVCKGDSGGGLLFLEEVGNKKLYHLRGIVSSGSRVGDSCDANKYAFFTNIAHFSQFIERFDLETNPSRGIAI